MRTRIYPGRRFFYLLAGALAGIMVLSGCASLSENECHNADWHLIGYEDGAAGRPAARLGEHREACSDYHVSPDLQAYRRGRQEGLREYCQPQRAYQLGRSGGAYPHVCPAEMEEVLRAAFREGRSVYELTSEINGIHRSLQHKQNELKRIEQTQISHTTEVVRPDVSSARRVQLLAESWDLAKRKGAVEDEIAELNQRLKTKRKSLSRLRSTTQY